MNVISHAVGVRLLGHRCAFEDNRRPIRHERHGVTADLTELRLKTPSDPSFLLARVADDLSLRVSFGWSASLASRRADR